MLSREEFVRRILDGAPRQAKQSTVAAASMLEGFDAFDVDEVSADAPADTRFAQLLLEESGFGAGQTLPREELVLGDQKTNRFLPPGVTYWQKTPERPFHIVLFELEKKGRELLDDAFFRQTDQLEDALHRVVQDALEGFERGGSGRTADRRQGAQTETLCVVSIVDDRNSGESRQLVCFGTKCIATASLEAFTLREEARDWAERGDRPLAEEHLSQLFERHFKPLSHGAKWQEAFVSGAERKKVTALMEACLCSQSELFGDAEEALLQSARDLLDAIAWSFGIPRKKANQNRCLEMVELPTNHSIAVDPDVSRREGFHNPLRGVRIYDSSARLLGFIVYTVTAKDDVERLREQLRAHNHFHNVLVIYASSESPELELWQGSEPLRGRLVSGNRRSRFDGEGGVVQLLSRFFVVSKSAVATPAQLAKELAWRARHLKALAVEELAHENERGRGPLKKLFDTFNQALATLSIEQFADAYAQTITYGMLAARWISTERQRLLFARKNLPELLPSTSAFLHDLFQKLVNSNFDKNLSWLLDDITSLLARTSVVQVFLGEKDPSIHFYQDFLNAYDPEIRKEQGVYYTPDEVVDYIVRTTHASLQSDFGLPLGLADTTSWSDFAKAKKLSVPAGVEPQAPFVQVLDPALGTGTFLLHVIEVIHETMQTEYARRGFDAETAKKEWLAYVRRELLPRLNGFELMMAPYIVSHLRLGLALQETGFIFDKQDRLRVFLTSTLETHTPSQLSFIGEHVAEEAKEAERVKTSIPISVMLGNPPYSGHSNNPGELARSLVEPYRSMDGKRLKLAQGKWLQNDYVKFIAYGEQRIVSTGCGIMGYITDHSYLDGDTFPGMRRHLLGSFSHIDVMNLHGNLTRRELPPGGGLDENVFNIQQGVAIFCGKLVPARAGDLATFRTADVWGPRAEKLQRLQSMAGKRDPAAWVGVGQFDSRYLFLNTSSGSEIETEFAQFDAIDAVFSRNGRPAPGFLTTHDDFAIAFTRQELEDNVKQLLATKSESDARAKFKLCGQSQWQYANAKRALSSGDWREQITTCLYRPFDERWTVYDPNVLVHRRERVNSHLIEPGNLALLTTRMTKGDDFGHVFVSDKITEVICLSSKTSANAFVFPLFVRDSDELRTDAQPNIDRKILEAYAAILPKKDLVPMALLEYWYAILNSPSYRRRYNGLLIREFPRVPRPSSEALFRELRAHGKQLIELHLLRKPTKGKPSQVGLSGAGDNQVAAGMPRFDEAKRRIWINAKQYFAGVDPQVWAFKIGSYEICRKWLSGRRGRALAEEECERFSNILDALRGTLKEQVAIDQVIDQYGGWPNAFHVNLHARSPAVTAKVG
jgi:hypothetical protein